MNKPSHISTVSSDLLILCQHLKWLPIQHAVSVPSNIQKLFELPKFFRIHLNALATLPPKAWQFENPSHLLSNLTQLLQQSLKHTTSSASIEASILLG